MHLGGMDFRLSPITKTQFSSAAAITGGIRDATKPKSSFAWLTKGCSSRLLLPDPVLWHFPTFLSSSYWLHTYFSFLYRPVNNLGLESALVTTDQGDQMSPLDKDHGSSSLLSWCQLHPLTISKFWEMIIYHGTSQKTELLTGSWGNSCWMLRSSARQGS